MATVKESEVKLFQTHCSLVGYRSVTNWLEKNPFLLLIILAVFFFLRSIFAFHFPASFVAHCATCPLPNYVSYICKCLKKDLSFLSSQHQQQRNLPKSHPTERTTTVVSSSRVQANKHMSITVINGYSHNDAQHGRRFISKHKNCAKWAMGWLISCKHDIYIHHANYTRLIHLFFVGFRFK